MDINELKKYTKISESMKSASETLRLMNEMKNITSPFSTLSSLNMPNLEHRFSMPRIPSHEEINEYQSAAVFMKALADDALAWKSDLPENYRPAILAFLYGGVQIQVHWLSQVSFHGIRIEGSLNGAPCSLLAHQSTVQMLCYAEEITVESPSNTIGFIWGNEKIEV